MCSSNNNPDPQPGFCSPPSGSIRGIIQPWLLLLLCEEPAHGYQLLEKLNGNDDTRGMDPGFLYRTLRQFEKDGLVDSTWDVKGAGPARRVYKVTGDGKDYLNAWISHVRATRERLGRLLDAHASRFPVGPMQNENEE
jgi:PadR family transcriptional regulator, regulatory protein PadR